MRTINRYLTFYQEGIVDWWNHITFWGYITLMVMSLIAGYFMMKCCGGRTT
jgi:hypothetical protein